MEMIMDLIKFIALNWEAILLGLIALLGGALMIALVIPGDQPDKFLQSAVDFLKKFSRKPSIEKKD